jgi:hypothetical protein
VYVWDMCRTTLESLQELSAVPLGRRVSGGKKRYVL